MQAQAAGVSTVFQEFNLLPDRTIAQNIYLGREPRRGPLVDTARMRRDTQELLDGLGVSGLSADDQVRTLSIAEQQVVEIAKAVSHEARIISMDEPTAALADHEVGLLYAIIRRLTDRGVAILYVSHRLKEIFDLCDTITVLKDGALVDSRPASRARRGHHRAPHGRAHHLRVLPRQAARAPRSASPASSSAAAATGTSTPST